MYRRERKIPTIIALFLLILGISTATYLDRSSQSYNIRAGIPSAPLEVHFTNISDSSFTVSWLTQKQTIGRIIVSNNSQKTTLLDDADSDNVARPRTTHYVTAKNLTEETVYAVKIISGDQSCKEADACPAFTQKTAVKVSSLLNLPPAHGTIVYPNNKPAEESIIYLTIGKSATLSGRSDRLGLWVIPFNNLRTDDLLTRPTVLDSDLIQITVKSSPSETASAVIDIKSIRQNLAIPKITLGNSYNFINLISKKNQLAEINNQKILGTKNQTVKETPPLIDILFPKSDNDFTPDKRPKLRGTGLPGTQVLITVKSSPQIGKVAVGRDGTWNWRPPKDLPPGIHEITVQGYDNLGNLVTVTRKFVVQKSGEPVFSVLGESTPSASLTPTTPVAAATPTLTSNLTPTSIPTTAIPTIQATAAPTSIPTATSSPRVEVTSAPPRTGSAQTTTIFFGAGATLLLLGVKLLLFP